MFYVYRIFGRGGETLYIGKGSGDRLATQIRRFGEGGEIISRHENEDAAYQEEAVLIEEQKPPLNKVPGGRRGGYPIRKRKMTEPEIMAGLLRKLITAAPGIRFYLLGEDVTDSLIDIIAAWFGRVGYETARSELAKCAVAVPPLEEFIAIA